VIDVIKILKSLDMFYRKVKKKKRKKKKKKVVIKNDRCDIKNEKNVRMF
jgi:hypothetical protein